MMKNSKDVLCTLLKTTQMGKLGIRSVLDTSMKPDLRTALHQQLRELDAIESEAHTIASQRGWELSEVDPAVRFLTDRMARLRITGRNTDSRIADMMIRGNTKGMIRGLRSLHQMEVQDSRVQTLSQRLLDCETAGISQMRSFL